jgi:hypothetical protein
MLDNFSFIVVPWWVDRLLVEWRGTHRLCAWMTSPRRNVAAGREYIKNNWRLCEISEQPAMLTCFHSAA